MLPVLPKALFLVSNKYLIERQGSIKVYIPHKLLRWLEELLFSCGLLDMQFNANLMTTLLD